MWRPPRFMAILRTHRSCLATCVAGLPCRRGLESLPKGSASSIFSDISKWNASSRTISKVTGSRPRSGAGNLLTSVESGSPHDLADVCWQVRALIGLGNGTLPEAMSDAQRAAELGIVEWLHPGRAAQPRLSMRGPSSPMGGRPRPMPVWMRCLRSILGSLLPAIPTGAGPLRSFFMTWRAVGSLEPRSQGRTKPTRGCSRLKPSLKGNSRRRPTNMRPSVQEPTRRTPGCGPANSLLVDGRGVEAVEQLKTGRGLLWPGGCGGIP